MNEPDQVEKVEVGVQTILHCYEDKEHNVCVSSNRGAQTVISCIPLIDDSDDSIFIGLLGFIPYSEISLESEKIIVLPRKKKLHWANPYTMELGSDTGSIRSILKYPKMDPEKVNQETQTIIAVYPHILEDDQIAHVMQDSMCQTSVTALPNESITNIIPILKQQLPHSSTPQNTISVSPKSLEGQQSASEPEGSNNPSKDSENASEQSSAPEKPLEDLDAVETAKHTDETSPEDSNILPEDSNIPPEEPKLTEDFDVPGETPSPTEDNQPSSLIEELQPEELKASPEETDPCSKNPCVQKVINRDDCFENKVREILQMAAEVFESEICEFFEEHPGEKKARLCKQLLSFAGISGSQDTDQWDKAVKDLDKIAADGVNEENVFSEDIIRPNGMNYNSGNCFCQKRTIRDVISPTKRPSKIPRLTQCCGKTAKFCGSQQSSKIPVLSKRRSKVSQQIQPCVTSSGPHDYKEVCFTFNLPSLQLLSTIEAKPQYEFNHRLPSAMKRSIQVGVGQCCSTRDGIQFEEVSSPEPIQNFVYECDAGYVESYLQSLGNEIKGCQTDRTELGEGDWDWEDDEEEDPCLCDPWKKIAVPLPGTYKLKKTKKLSVEEEREHTSTNEMEFVSAESKKLPTLEQVKLPVYDPKYFKMTELYMEPLYDLYPIDTEPDDVCGPETEMPWEDIVLPEKCRIKKANPTVCTCPGRKQFSVYSSSNETDTQTSSFGTANISAKATTKGKSSTIVIHIKSLNEDDTNSDDSESVDSVCLKELPFYGTSKSTGTCGCPKRQLSTDTEGRLPSKSPRSVLEMKSKNKTLDIPSNPPNGLQKIIKKVCIRPTFKEISCETDNKSTDIDKCDQATETISTSKIQCSKPDVNKTCTRKPKPNPKCRCRNSRSKSDLSNDKSTKETSTCTSKTMVRQRAGANATSKNSVGCGSGIYVAVAAAERDKQRSESTPKTISVSSKETHTDRTVPIIRASISLKRVAQPNEKISKEIPLNNEVFEIYSKGQTKVLGFKKASNFEDSADNVQSEDLKEREKEAPSTQEDACSPSKLQKPQRKYPVVAALNAFEEEMRPLRAALCQLQKRIYSLDLPEMQSRQSIPKPTVDTAVLAKGPSTVSGLQSSTTNVTTSTEPFLCSRKSEADTLMNSSTTTSLSNDSDESED